MAEHDHKTPDGMITEKLYSPLFVKIVAKENEEFYDGDYWNDPVSQTEAVGYAENIQLALLKERAMDNEPRGLMAYFRAERNEAVEEKVRSLFVDVEIHEGKLWGVATLRMTAELAPEEMEALKDYLTGQYSDGFGEGFEQREIRVDEDELYVSLWESGRKFFIDTSLEFEQRLGLDTPLVDRSYLQRGGGILPADVSEAQAQTAAAEPFHGDDNGKPPSVLEQIRRPRQEAKAGHSPTHDKAARERRDPER
jgi:hypothetical protein